MGMHFPIDFKIASREGFTASGGDNGGSWVTAPIWRKQIQLANLLKKRGSVYQIIKTLWIFP